MVYSRDLGLPDQSEKLAGASDHFSRRLDRCDSNQSQLPDHFTAQRAPKVPSSCATRFVRASVQGPQIQRQEISRSRVLLPIEQKASNSGRRPQQ